MIWVFAIASDERSGVPIFLYENEDGWSPRVEKTRKGSEEEIMVMAQAVSRQEQRDIYMFTLAQAREEERKGWEALMLSATFNDFSPLDILH